MASRPDAVARLRQIVNELRGAAALDWAMVGVALREARALVESAVTVTITRSDGMDS